MEASSIKPLQPTKWYKGREQTCRHCDHAVILILGVLLALGLRYALKDFRSGDLVYFLEPWYRFIDEHGEWGALKYAFSDYTPPYLYLMSLAHWLFHDVLPPLYAIKLISVSFDFIGAFFVYKIVKLLTPQGMMPIFAFLATLFAPTVFMNSALWAQVDMGYTAGLLACLYFLLVKRETLAFLAFGAAFSFKLQAVFLAPFLLFLWIKRIVRFRSFLLIPLVYFIAILPAWLAGRPLSELLRIYLEQAQQYRKLTFEAANVYQWLPEQLYDIFLPAGLIWTSAAVFLLLAGAYRSIQEVTRHLMIYLALFSALIIPYLLPKMHERYFFPADVISIPFAFYFPRFFWVPIAVGLVSFFSYTPFLFGIQLVPLQYLPIPMGMVIATLAWYLAVHLKEYS